MTIIDRYLLRQFFQVFVVCFVSLNGLFIVFHGFNSLDEFLLHAEKQGNLLGMMAEFYGYRTISFFDQFGGILAMIATMFTATWIQRHNEMTALMAAGISRLRVITPLVLAAAVISLLAAGMREAVIPNLREQLTREPKDLLGDVAQNLDQRYDNTTDILFDGEKTFANEKRIHGPNFQLPEGLDTYGAKLIAEDAYYQPATAERPGGYLFMGVTQPADLAEVPSLFRGDQRVIITPHDEPEWLAKDECFVVSLVTFDQLTAGRTWRQYSSTPELIRGLSNPSLDFGADVRVTIHSRIVQPLLDLTLLFLGLPLVMGRDSRNMFLAIGICSGVVGGFMLVVIGAQALGGMYFLSPAFAAWVPLMVFVPVAAGLAERLRQ